MNLIQMTLDNFRQFKGKQTIIFPEGKTNVTVVYGENGRGKTGLFRALLFALFGDRHLPQDIGTDLSELFLVNRAATINASGAVEGGVEVIFAHDGVEYQIKRTMLASAYDGGQREELGKVILSQKDASGNTTFIEPDQMKRVIEKVLNPRVKEYFFFDGEKMEMLTRSNKEQRSEVSKGIRSLLQIDVLDQAIKATRSLTKELEKESQRGANPEYAQASQALEEQRTLRDQKYARLEQVRDEISLGEDELAAFDKRLKEIEEIKDDVKNLDECRRRRDSLDIAIQDQKRNMREQYGIGGFLLLSPLIGKMKKHIDSMRARGDIPSPIRVEFINRLIESGKCICGCELKEGSSHYRELIRWRDTIAGQTDQDKMIDLLMWLNRIVATNETKKSTIDQSLQRIGTDTAQKEEILEQIHELEEIVADKIREDDRHLPDLRKSCNDRIITAKVELSRLEEDIASIEAEIKKLERHCEQYEKEQEAQNVKIGRTRMAREANKALIAVQQEFINDVRKSLGEKSTHFFHLLIDPEGARVLGNLVIEKDFSLQILDHTDSRFLANISQGQRQIASMAFIAALATSASDGKMNMPLFMDTPFGRLSATHRSKLIQTISGICSQWILLATDTELRLEEAEEVLRSGRWGKMYILCPNADGSTTITPENPEVFIAGLRGMEDIVHA